MVIRTREDALKALSEVLHLDRRQQIVQITVKLAMCLTPEARQILFRAQEGVVTGGLTVRLKARETMQRPRPSGPQVPKELQEPEEIDDGRVSEEIHTAFEALKVAAVVYDVFRGLGAKFARWEVARAALHFPEEMKRLITEGTDGSTTAERELTTIVSRFRPWWHSQVAGLAQACERVRRQQPDSAWRVGARSLLDIVCTTELRAMYAAKESIPTLEAMIEPLTKIYRALQRIVVQVYPRGLPAESALAE